MYGYEIFHNEIALDLINSIHNNSVRHAYLFCGPRGVGKMRVAKLFANALVCQNIETSPCGNCNACVVAKQDNNPDIIYISPKEKKSISVEQTREIITDSYTKPFESSKKVYIIEDASLLNEQSQNCLLKILEEPPEYAVFIILATAEEELLQTILSRCTKIDFPRVSDEIVRSYIEKNFSDTTINKDLLVTMADGICGDIKNILDDPDYEIIREESFKILTPLFSRYKVSSYKVCEFLEEYKDKTQMIFNFWESFVRDIMMIQNQKYDLVVNIDLQEELKKIANQFDEKMPIIALEHIIVAKSMLKRYVNLHSLGLYLSFSIKNELHNL